MQSVLLHCDFFAVVDHVVFMVTVQIYVFAATIVINFIVVIILKSHFIFSYSFLFVPRSKRKGRYIPVPAAQEKRLVLKNRVCLVPRLEAE